MFLIIIFPPNFFKLDNNDTADLIDAHIRAMVSPYQDRQTTF
jgi:hypothetical protein